MKRCGNAGLGQARKRPPDIWWLLRGGREACPLQSAAVPTTPCRPRCGELCCGTTHSPRAQRWGSKLGAQLPDPWTSGRGGDSWASALLLWSPQKPMPKRVVETPKASRRHLGITRGDPQMFM